MMVLGDNGRNRIAAPIMHSVPHSIEDVWEPNALTHGHEWRAGLIEESKRHMAVATHDGGKDPHDLSSWVGTAIPLRPLVAIPARELR